MIVKVGCRDILGWYKTKKKTVSDHFELNIQSIGKSSIGCAREYVDYLIKRLHGGNQFRRLTSVRYLIQTFFISPNKWSFSDTKNIPKVIRSSHVILHMQ